MHLVFLSSTSQLSVKLRLRPCHSAPLNHSSCGSNQRTAESPFYIAVQDSQHCLSISSYSQFWETPVQLNSVKKKIDLKICPFFSCWVQCCIFPCFVKLWFLNGKSCQGVHNRGQKLFLFPCVSFREKNNFIQKKKVPVAAVFKENYEKV